MNNKIKILALTLLLISCGGISNSSFESHNSFFVSNDENSYVQEDDTNDKKIFIGNTMPSTYIYAAFGTSFNIGIETVLNSYNQKGGYKGYSVELKNYDSCNDEAKGLSYTKKLVEEDEVFALVGQFGDDTVSKTLDYITEKGIPMVSTVSSVSSLYNIEAKGNQRAIMPVQPIYDGEGEVLLARAVASLEGNMGLGGKKIGVISTTDAIGSGMLKGIENEAEKLGVENILYVKTSSDIGTNHTSNVSKLKNAGCDVVIVATNQAVFYELMTYFKTLNYDDVKMIVSYLLYNDTAVQNSLINDFITDKRELYINEWLDYSDDNYVYIPDSSNEIGLKLWENYKYIARLEGNPNLYDEGITGYSKEYLSIIEDIFEYVILNEIQIPFNALIFNSLLGYISGFIFVQGLERLESKGLELTWENYYNAMELDVIEYPIGGAVDFRNGSRVGTQNLGLKKYIKNTKTGFAEIQDYSPIINLADVEAAI